MSGVHFGRSVFKSAVSAALALAGSAVAAGAALANEPVVLSPSSQWHLDYAEDRCKLMRVFGEGDDKSVILLEQLSPSSHLELTVAGKPFRTMRDRQEISVQMGPGHPAFERSFQRGSFASYKPALIFGHLSPLHPFAVAGEDPEMNEIAAAEKAWHPSGVLVPANGAEIDWIELRQRKQVIRLDTGNLENAFTAMNTCTDHLLKSWGVDAEEFASVTQKAEWTNLQDVAERIQRRYPSRALNRGSQANFRMRLFIDESGRVTDCKLLELTEGENFDNTPCAIMVEHARFKPARNADGTAVNSYDMVTVRYVMGG